MTPYIKKQLLRNWGEAAEALNCFCPIKYIDKASHWECFVYALNPSDEDEILCIINAMSVESTKWSLKELLSCYNAEGDYVVIDDEYIPVHLTNILKRLNERPRH